MFRNNFLILTVTVVSVFLLSSEHVQSETTCFRGPNICPNENVTFWAYTRNAQDGELLDIHNFAKLNEQLGSTGKIIKILIHGFTSNRNDAFNNATRKALFELGDFYVISVNWTPLTQKGCREVSSLNTRVVGNCTANFIDRLVEHTSAELKNIHVIGFSLGAQCAGFISPNLKKGKIVRISGLDPTLPNFDTTDLSERLDASDADYVDVYHTASGNRSQIVPCGNIDSYFNAGDEQPGCEEGDKNPDNPYICSHKRSFEYFTESMNTKIGFYGHECKFEGSVPLDNCNSKATQLIGYHVPIGTTGVYEVYTASTEPYARGSSA